MPFTTDTSLALGSLLVIYVIWALVRAIARVVVDVSAEHVARIVAFVSYSLHQIVRPVFMLQGERGAAPLD